MTNQKELKNLKRIQIIGLIIVCVLSCLMVLLFMILVPSEYIPGILMIFFSLAGVPVVWGYWKGRRLLREGESAVATITTYKMTMEDDDKVFLPEFEFTVRETQYKAISSQGYRSFNKDYKIGEKVNVRYMRDNPQKAEIDNAVKKNVTMLFVATVFLLILMAGGVLLLISPHHHLDWLIGFLSK